MDQADKYLDHREALVDIPPGQRRLRSAAVTEELDEDHNPVASRSCRAPGCEDLALPSDQMIAAFSSRWSVQQTQRAIGEEVELHSDDLRIDRTCALGSTQDGGRGWLPLVSTGNRLQA